MGIENSWRGPPLNYCREQVLRSQEFPTGSLLRTEKQPNQKIHDADSHKRKAPRVAQHDDAPWVKVEQDYL